MADDRCDAPGTHRLITLTGNAGMGDAGLPPKVACPQPQRPTEACALADREIDARILEDLFDVINRPSRRQFQPRAMSNRTGSIAQGPQQPRARAGASSPSPVVKVSGSALFETTRRASNPRLGRSHRQASAQGGHGY
jgi:hypothetical protein